MICPNCKVEMKEIDQFCMNCGASLSTVEKAGEHSLNKEESMDTSETKLQSLDVAIVDRKEDMPLTMIHETSSEEPESFVFEFNHEIIEAEEEENPLAAGLPDWDILPPETVSRKRRQL